MRASFLTLLGLSFILVACHSKTEKESVIVAPQNPMETHGGAIIEGSYDSGNPRDVYFYQADSNGERERYYEAHYYEDNKVYVEGGIKADQRDGIWRAYFENGRLQAEAEYENGVQVGKELVFYENGELFYEGYYTAGNCSGTWSWYTPEGKLEKTIVADEQTICCRSCPKCHALKLQAAQQNTPINE